MAVEVSKGAIVASLRLPANPVVTKADAVVALRMPANPIVTKAAMVVVLRPSNGNRRRTSLVW